MIENATLYWHEFPSKILNCCTDSRQENVDMVENEEKLNINLAQVQRVNFNVYFIKLTHYKLEYYRRP